MGHSRNLLAFNFAILLKSRKLDAREMFMFCSTFALAVIVRSWLSVVAECGEADIVAGDELDCAAADADADVNVQLKQLCARLRTDLKNILLLSTAECQVLVRVGTDLGSDAGPLPISTARYLLRVRTDLGSDAGPLPIPTARYWLESEQISVLMFDHCRSRLPGTG